MRSYKIAVIPGDGIGKEVMPEGVRALEGAAKRFGFDIRQDWFDFASADYYAEHGRMMPEDWKERIGSHDAILFGAVGWPATIPDHISLWGSLLQFRREFDQYVNLRPVRLMPGVACPLLALWGEHGAVHRCFDVLALWRERAEDVRGRALPGGHYLAEQLPDEVAEELAGFFA